MSRARRTARRFSSGFRDDSGERGAIIIVAAVALTIFVFAAALAVDIGGRVQTTRREQAVADLAALDAAHDLSSDAATQALAVASALRNGVDATKPGYSVIAVRGTLASGIFTANPANPNAVQVTVITPYSDFFGGGIAHLSRSAIGQGTNCTSSCSNPCVGPCSTPSPTPTPSVAPTPKPGQAQFWIGSTLADINLGLEPFGTGRLTLLGYQGLATGNVTLGALGTALGFSTLTPDQVLASYVKVSDLVNASASLLNANNPTAAADLTTLGSHLATSLDTTTTILVGDALGLKTGQGAVALTQVNLLEMVAGGVEVANQNAGLAVNLALSLPLLGGASVTFAGISPPTLSPYGPVGIWATNTQVTATLTVSLNVSVVGLSISSVQLPLVMTLGGATGTLTEIDCASGNPVDIQLKTAFNNVVATIQNGVVNGPTVLGSPTILGTVTGNINVPSSSVTGTVVNDPANFVGASPQAAVTASSNLGTATASLTTNLTLTPLLDVTTSNAIAAAIDPILPTLINTIASTLQTTYGIHIGNASYLGVSDNCGSVKLGG